MIARLVALVLGASTVVLGVSAPATPDSCATPHTGHMTFNPCAVLDTSRVRWANEPLSNRP